MNQHAARLLAVSLVLSAGTHVASAQSPSGRGIAPVASASVASATVTAAPAEVASAIDLHLTPAGLGGDHWRGGILLDEGFRGMVRLSAIDDQETARTISDVTLVSTMLMAVADGSVVPLLQGQTDLAWQAQFAHLLALGVTIGAGEIVKRSTSRARPYERECAANPERHGCQDSGAFESFYSLHSGVAFTSAGFSCSMHLSRSLYGDVAADATSCALSLAMATTTGLLRVLSDRHYLSDVMIGAALGFLVGYLLPLAIVPERSAGAAPESGQSLIAPATSAGGAGALGGGIGLSFSGVF